MPGSLHGRKVLVNRADLNTIGKPEAEVLGKTDAELFPPDIAARFEAADQTVLQAGRPLLNHEKVVAIREGKEIWLLTSKLPLRRQRWARIHRPGRHRPRHHRPRGRATRCATRRLRRWHEPTLEPDHLDLKREVNELLARPDSRRAIPAPNHSGLQIADCRLQIADCPKASRTLICGSLARFRLERPDRTQENSYACHAQRVNRLPKNSTPRSFAGVSP